VEWYILEGLRTGRHSTGGPQCATDEPSAHQRREPRFLASIAGAQENLHPHKQYKPDSYAQLPGTRPCKAVGNRNRARRIGNRHMNSAVMLSEAKHLWSISGGTRSKTDPRFFGSLRMTLRAGL